MSRSKPPAVPIPSIERLFKEFMKLHAATIEGTYEQSPKASDPDDFDEFGDYRPRPLFEHLYAIASFLGGDVEDRFSDCLETTKSLTFRPEAWGPDEEEGDEDEDEVRQAAE
jgi:hypothetical protein